MTYAKVTNVKAGGRRVRGSHLRVGDVFRYGTMQADNGPQPMWGIVADYPTSSEGEFWCVNFSGSYRKCRQDLDYEVPHRVAVTVEYD